MIKSAFNYCDIDATALQLLYHYQFLGFITAENRLLPLCGLFCQYSVFYQLNRRAPVA